jgi:hypothetical protein
MARGQNSACVAMARGSTGHGCGRGRQLVGRPWPSTSSKLQLGQPRAGRPAFQGGATRRDGGATGGGGTLVAGEGGGEARRQCWRARWHDGGGGRQCGARPRRLEKDGEGDMVW